MYTYVRIVDWDAEYRSGRTVYEARHAIRNTTSGIIEIARTYHFVEVRPTRAEAEAAGQLYVDRLNQKIQDRQNEARIDRSHFEQIKEQLQELVSLGVSPVQIRNRLNTLIANLKADNGIS
jgi:hypothetical protein